MISKDMLNDGLPPSRNYTNKSVSCVLTYRSLQGDELYIARAKELVELGQLSMWSISNTVYYRLHPDEFEGWLELEPDADQEMDLEGWMKFLETTSVGGGVVGKYCNECPTGQSYVCTCNYVDPLIVFRAMMNRDLPPMIEYDNGCMNFVLACRSDSIYSDDGSNSYIPRWTVVGTKFYHLHPENYDGWIELDCRWNGEVVSTRHELIADEVFMFEQAKKEWGRTC